MIHNLKNFINKLRQILSVSQGSIQSFTYYIPAPPPRKSGYREKDFDKLFYQFINQGHEIISINTTPHTSDHQCGMWVMVTVKSKGPIAQEINLNFPPIKDDQTKIEFESAETGESAFDDALKKDLYFD